MDRVSDEPSDQSSPVRDELSEDLNSRFYANDPGDYFRRRLLNLLLTATRSHDLEGLLENGLQFGKLRLAYPSRPGANDESEGVVDSGTDTFTTVEAEVLFHHSSEVLLRLFLAHRDLPPCPWIELARLRYPRQFKDAVAKQILNRRVDELEDDLIPVFLGNADPGRLGVEGSPEDWAVAATNIRKVLRHCAAEILDGANLYNAAKHGMGVSSGTTSFAFGENLESPALFVEGLSIQYLEVVDAKPDPEKWGVTTAWVSTERTIGLSYLVCDALESLWSVAKWRYRGEKEVTLFLPTQDFVGVVRDSTANHPIRKFTEHISVFKKPRRREEVDQQPDE